MKKSLISAMMAVMLLGTSGVLPSNAKDHPGYFKRHAYQKTELIGAGVGAVAGGVLSGDKHRKKNVVKGAVVGAGAGVGYQYLKKKGVIPKL